MKKGYLLFFLLSWVCLTLEAQKVAWDNPAGKSWPAGFGVAEIPPQAGSSMQRARFYAAKGEEPRPLVVSLHTWSGDYNQEDPLAAEALLRNWNYIHPDFRGANNRPEACGSPRVIADIADAIRYAVRNAPVDTAEIHVIGVSGGGHAALMAFLQLPLQVASFSAWVPVTDLEAWHWESLARKNRYAGDVLLCTSPGETLNGAEARRRSPLFASPAINRKGKSSLFLYAGIHDGYSGSVPVSHTVAFFNRIARAWYPGNETLPVSDSLLLSLVTRRMNSHPDTLLTLAGRKVHLLRQAPGLSLFLFEGTHEMLVPQALSLLPVDGGINRLKCRILTIGDSNGAATDGWPRQLNGLLPFSNLLNLSVSGNTLGFDNLGRSSLNALRNINASLDSACLHLGSGPGKGCIIFGLGTNDAKRVFADSTRQVAHNLDLLLERTQAWFREKELDVPQLLVLTPPPMEEALADSLKYGGGNERIRRNNKAFRRIARLHGAILVDIHALFPENSPGHTTDGVHLTAEAQLRVAREILSNLDR